MNTIKTILIDALIALIAPVCILIAQILRMGLFPELVELDRLMHFLGGASIAVMALIIWKRWSKRKWVTAKPMIVWLYGIWTTVAVVGVLWEFWEWWMQYTTGDVYQLSITDTMDDLLMDLLGGATLLLIYTIARSKKK